MIDQSTPKGRIVAAALDLAAQRRWDEVTFVDIAEAAGVNLMELRREVSSKGEILTAFSRIIDDEILAKAARPVPGQSKRDSLFEVVMSRFDALQPYKAALMSIAASRTADPMFVRSFLTSQAWMLRAAGVETEGVGGGIRVAGLASIYASVFKTWLEDNDPGLARTMAVLDRRLRRGERTLGSIEGACESLSRLAGLFVPGQTTTKSEATTVPQSPPPAAPL